MDRLDASGFETRAAQDLSGMQAAKMRVEFTIPTRMCENVTEMMDRMNLQATIYEAKACGCKKQKYTIDINRGTRSIEMNDSDRRTVVSIVDSDKVEELVDLVRAAVGRDGSTVALSEVHSLLRL
jgi:hypothetical protein